MVGTSNQSVPEMAIDPRINLLEGIVEMILDFWREPERQEMLGPTEVGGNTGEFVQLYLDLIPLLTPWSWYNGIMV